MRATASLSRPACSAPPTLAPLGSRTAGPGALVGVPAAGRAKDVALMALNLVTATLHASEVGLPENLLGLSSTADLRALDISSIAAARSGSSSKELITIKEVMAFSGDTFQPCKLARK